MQRIPLLVLVLTLAVGCASPVLQPIAPAHATPALWPDAVHTRDEMRLPLIRWGPVHPEAVVLGLHGFTEHAHTFSRLAVALEAHDIAFYAYDQRGFGSTPHRGYWAGEDIMVQDARDTWALLKEKYPDRPVVLLGMSMGSAVSILAVTGDEAIDTDGVILMSPAIWGADIMPWYQQVGLWVGVRTIPGIDLDVRLARDLANVQATDDPDVQHEVDNDPLLLNEVRADMVHGVAELMNSALYRLDDLTIDNGLILYGLRDEVIPRDAACIMLQRLPKSELQQLRLALYPDGHHMLARDRQAGNTHQDIAAWIADPRGPLPSGFETSFRQGQEQVCD